MFNERAKLFVRDIHRDSNIGTDLKDRVEVGIESDSYNRQTERTEDTRRNE